MKLPLRVAMIIRPYHPPVGGAERQLAALIPLLKLHNIEVNVVTRRYPGQNAFDLVEGVPVYRIRVWSKASCVIILHNHNITSFETIET